MNLSSKLAAGALAAAATLGLLGVGWASAQEDPTTTAPPATEAPAEEAPETTQPPADQAPDTTPAPGTRPGRENCPDKGTGSGGSADESTDQAPTATQTRARRVRSV